MSISRQQVEAQVPKSSSTRRNGNDEDEEGSQYSPWIIIKRGGMQQEAAYSGRRKAGGGAVIRYRECQKNHAASMGGNARDGCGEFMANGEQGTVEALKCSACGCHRNFHRKETQGGDHDFPSSCHHHPHHIHHNNINRRLTINNNYPGGTLQLSSRILTADPHGEEEISGTPKPSISTGDDHHHHNQQGAVKKRFRTKFTQEQKEKMLKFAERAGWRIQKQEESVVQQFCQEIGIKRRVLKVWMHNNKRNFPRTTKPSSSTD